MKKEEKINEIIDNLVKTGSTIPYIDDLKNKSMNIANKDESLDKVLNEISNEIKEETFNFLNKKNQNDINLISGISTCIYFPSNGEYKLKLIGGKRNRDLDLKVDENTLFDVASITKLYTLLLVFKLEEKGLINLNDKIVDINPDFKNLEDFTWRDLIRMHGEFRTNGLISSAKNKEEAYNILKTIYLYSNTREQNKYNDFGPIIMSDTLEKVISKQLGKNMSFDEIMKEYLLNPLNLNRTTFNPKEENVSGNGNDLGLVHDPKARLLGGALGHAGIFTTSNDIAKLSKEIYSLNYINKKHINELGEMIFPSSPQWLKGNMGVYLKNPNGNAGTFTPSEFSNGSFSHQGWTGAVATFDPNNSIHTNILVNAIYKSDNKELIKNDKPIGYMDSFLEYEANINRNVMLMYVAKKYYNEYCNVKEEINDVKFI